MRSAPTRAEALEQVRVNLLRYLEKYPNIDIYIIARATGYSYDAIQKYRNGDLVTAPVARAIVRSYPEIGRGIACPHCGAMPLIG